MKGDLHVRFCGGLGVKLLMSTRQSKCHKGKVFKCSYSKKCPLSLKGMVDSFPSAITYISFIICSIKETSVSLQILFCCFLCFPDNIVYFYGLSSLITQRGCIHESIYFYRSFGQYRNNTGTEKIDYFVH